MINLTDRYIKLFELSDMSHDTKQSAVVSLKFMDHQYRKWRMQVHSSEFWLMMQIGSPAFAWNGGFMPEWPTSDDEAIQCGPVRVYRFEGNGDLDEEEVRWLVDNFCDLLVEFLNGPTVLDVYSSIRKLCYDQEDL